MITMVISSWWRWWKRNMHSWWEVNSKGVSLVNAAKKALLHFWLSFHDRLVYEDKVCSILVKIMITTLWMFYSCFEWLFHTRAAPAEHCFPSKFFFCPLPVQLCPVPVQLAIHSPKLLPQRIYMCVQSKTILCTLGTIAVQKGKRHFWLKVYFRSCAWICRSAPYFLPQVSAFRPTQLRHSLRVKGRFPLKYVFVLGVTSR